LLSLVFEEVREDGTSVFFANGFLN